MEKSFTVQEVALGLGVKPDHIRRYLRYYKAKRSGSRWLLTREQVWGLINVIRIYEGGLWSNLGADELERLIGPMPKTAIDDFMEVRRKAH